MCAVKQDRKPIILVDGSSYLFRAFYALPALHNAQGEPTGAMYGVLNMLRKLLKDHAPQHIAVIFDSKKKTFRSELYPEYKANRQQMPEELQQQIHPLHEAIRALGLPLLIVEGVEADDVIATLALEAGQKKYSVLISTGDKDLAQLVNQHITLINTMTNKEMDIEGVIEKFGVQPTQIVDFLSLTGDSVDNVPGIPNVGPKTAAKWLNEYGNLAELIQNAEHIKGKVGENLRANLDVLKTAKALVTVKTDVTLPVHIEDLHLGKPDEKKLVELFRRFEFKSWLAEYANHGSEKMKSDVKKYFTITTQKDFSLWLKKLTEADYFAFDTETTSLNPIQAELVGVSFAVKACEAAYVPLAHDYLGAPKQLDRNWVLGKLKPLLENPNKIVIGQNLKYDMEVLHKYNISIQAKIHDTLLESYVLNNKSSRHDMDTLALKYLDIKTIAFEDIAGKGKSQLTFNQIPLKQATDYAAEDADITLQLHEKMWQLIKNSVYQTILTTIEWPLVAVLAKMECNGVLISAPMLQKQSQELEKRILALEQQAYQLAGAVFNLASPKQLQEIFYQRLKLPILKKTPTGQASTGEEVLEDLAKNYPLPKIILEYRGLSKLKSTYTDKLPLQINPKTRRVHTSYNQTVTSTGRLSSTDPNLQNIPARTEEGRKIRQAFIAPKGYKIIAADYSQVELRIMAHLSQDPGLLSAFTQGLDIHRSTAAEVFDVTTDKVTDEQRRQAKAINFGLMYGMSSFGLSRQLNISRQMAQEYINIYFSRYPKVHEYMEQARAYAKKQGYVETLLGRKLFIPDIHEKNLQRRNAAERAAINAPLQGSAADIIKLAMIRIAQWIETQKLDIKMIMQVHDELVFEAALPCLQFAVSQIKHHMENAVALTPALVVDVGVGDNWEQAH